MLILATAAASEEISRSVHLTAFGSFALAGFLVVITAGLWLFAPTKSRLGAGVALAGSLLGAVAVFYAAYMHHIDFVPVASDGTPASAPLWMALLVPCVPFFAHTILLVAHRRRASTSQT
jgi:hypothetical protein